MLNFIVIAYRFTNNNHWFTFQTCKTYYFMAWAHSHFRINDSRCVHMCYVIVVQPFIRLFACLIFRRMRIIVFAICTNSNWIMYNFVCGTNINALPTFWANWSFNWMFEWNAVIVGMALYPSLWPFSMMWNRFPIYFAWLGHFFLFSSPCRTRRSMRWLRSRGNGIWHTKKCVFSPFFQLFMIEFEKKWFNSAKWISSKRYF